MQKRRNGIKAKSPKLTVSQINTAARKRIATIAEEAGLSRCELRFDGCMGTFGIAPAHRHPRGWYKRCFQTADDHIDLLSTPMQWVAACVYCHEILDNRAKTTEEKKEEIFNRLRP